MGGDASIEQLASESKHQSSAKIMQRRYKEDWEYLQQCGEAHK